MTLNEFDKKLLNINNSLEEYAYNLTFDRVDAKILLQETFLQAIKLRTQFDDKYNLKVWMFIMMRHTFIKNYSIIQSRHQNDNNALLFPNHPIISIENSVAAYSDKASIQNTKKLNDKFRQTLNMHMEGHKYKTIADAFNLKVETVKRSIFFSRKEMMDQLIMPVPASQKGLENGWHRAIKQK